MTYSWKLLIVHKRRSSFSQNRWKWNKTQVMWISCPFRSLRVLMLLRKKLRSSERVSRDSRCFIWSFVFSLCWEKLSRHEMNMTVCFPPAVTLSSTDRWDGSSSPSSAAWLTSATPSTGCHLASCGRGASPTGWWDWWAQSRLWLDWSRWTQAAVTRQTVHNYLIFMNEWKCWWKILNERMCHTLINVIRHLYNHQWKAKKNPISQISFLLFFFLLLAHRHIHSWCALQTTYFRCWIQERRTSITIL